MAERTEGLQVSAKAIEEARIKCNEALRSNNLEVYNETYTQLQKEVKNFNTLSEKAAYESFAGEEKPIVALVNMFFFDCKKESEERAKETNKLLGVKVDPTKKRLSIGKFVKNYGFDSSVMANIAELFELFKVREKDILGMTPVEFQEEYKKGSSFYRETVDAIKKGETPTSNTKIAAKLQEIINKCGASEAWKYQRVTNIDIRQLTKWMFNHDGKNKCSDKVCTAGKFETYILDVLEHHINGTPYAVIEKRQ